MYLYSSRVRNQTIQHKTARPNACDTVGSSMIALGSHRALMMRCHVRLVQDFCVRPLVRFLM